MAKKGKPKASDRSTEVFSQDTRPLYELSDLRYRELIGPPISPIDDVVEHAGTFAPDVYERLLARAGNVRPTIELFVEVLNDELAARSGDARLLAIVLLHKGIRTVSLPAIIREVSETWRARLLDTLGDVLKDPDPRIRQAAIELLDSLIHDSHKQSIMAILIRPELGITDPDEETALAAIGVLARIDQDTASEAVHALCQAAQSHPAPAVQIAVCHRLKALGIDSLPAVPTLLKLATESPNDDVRLAVVAALLAVAVFDDVVAELKPYAERLRPVLRAGGEKYRPLRLAIEGSRSVVPSGKKKPELVKGEKNIIEVIRDAGKRLTNEKVQEALSKKGYPSGTNGVKTKLASLRRRGFLTNDISAEPPGYGLPEWSK
jgi:hypothetical protein